MLNAQEMLDLQFPEMRWRCLSLAADLDRLQRGDKASLPDDRRLRQLRQAIEVLLDDSAGRAARVQMIFSDLTPAPVKK